MYHYEIGEGVDHPLFLFTSVSGLTFNVRFEKFPYDFLGTDIIRSISVGCEENVKPPLDARVGETVCFIIEQYLIDNPNELLSYVCDDLDNKGSVRQRKFNGWHKCYGNGNLSAVPQTITSFDNTQIYTCLIFDPLIHDENIVIDFYEKEIRKLESKY